jgi:hypothetical protein
MCIATPICSNSGDFVTLVVRRTAKQPATCITLGRRLVATLSTAGAEVENRDFR